MLLCPVGTLTSDSAAYPTLALSTLLAPCSGKGQCMSLREVSEYQDYDTHLGYTSYTNGWDADMIHACVCDEGWEGVSCTKRSCPKGDDPTTVGVDEVQLIDCQCAQCAGGLHLTFEGFQTPFIPYDASEELVLYRLAQLPGVEHVEVEFLRTPLTDGGLHPTEFCSSTGTITQVTFKVPQYKRTPMILTNAGGNRHSRLTGLHIAIRSGGEVSAIDNTIGSTSSTREHVECSNKGKCNHDEGVCKCYDGYRSSNGMGGQGIRGDCGNQYDDYLNYTVYSTITNSTTNQKFAQNTRLYSKCPFEFNAICSGNGTCDAVSGQCECNSGYGNILYILYTIHVLYIHIHTMQADLPVRTRHVDLRQLGSGMSGHSIP